MPGVSTLLEQGFTLPGMPRKEINTDTGEVGYEQSGMGAIAKGLTSFLLAREKEQKKQQEEMKTQSDMYKSLREAGYDSQSAFDAVMKRKMPTQAGGEALKEQKEKQDISESKAKEAYYTSRANKPDTEVKITLNEAVKKAQSGEITWDDVTEKFPTKIKEIEKVKKQLTPISKNPNFKEVGGLSTFKAFKNPDISPLSSRAKGMIGQITDELAFDEFMDDVDAMIKKGLFTEDEKNQVLEYFGKRK